jgi:predicted O-methyltransferase YrrM
MSMRARTRPGHSELRTGSTSYTRRAVFHSSRTPWLAPVQLAASTLARLGARPESISNVVTVLHQLKPDDYLEFMLEYYAHGLERFGSHWGYMDLLTVLEAAATLLEPEEYLEIGVRRGRSMAIVGAARPNCAMVGFDLWIDNYAGMPNPGASFVREELAEVGHRGSLELVSGDSRQTVPAFLNRYPDRTFDLIAVDGDHSDEGASLDLTNVLPRLRVGGAIMLDDIAHPEHLHLASVWDRIIGSDARFDSYKYTELGYGVAFAVRRH